MALEFTIAANSFYYNSYLVWLSYYVHIFRIGSIYYKQIRMECVQDPKNNAVIIINNHKYYN